MTQKTALRLFVHVEEPSMEQAMKALLPNLLGETAVEWKVIDHGSKQALLTNLPKRMHGYAQWPEPGLRVLVLVDRDDDDCVRLKQQLEAAARGAGMSTKTAPDTDGRFNVVNRIVVEELEAWFLGDVPALTMAFRGVSSNLGKQAKYRDPDAVVGAWEALFRVLKAAGHYRGAARLPKIDVPRRVAPLMDAANNRSHSFQSFAAGLQSLLVAE